MKEKYGEAERVRDRKRDSEGNRAQSCRILYHALKSLDSIQRTKDVFVIVEYSQPLRNSSPIN